MGKKNDNEVLNLNIIVIVRGDGSVEARCTELDIAVIAEDYEKALAELWNAIGNYLSIANLEKFTDSEFDGLPYYGPLGGLS